MRVLPTKLQRNYVSVTLCTGYLPPGHEPSVLQFLTGVFLTPSQVYDTEQRPLLRCIRIMDPIMDLVNNQIMGRPREHLASGTVVYIQP